MSIFGAIEHLRGPSFREERVPKRKKPEPTPKVNVPYIPTEAENVCIESAKQRQKGQAPLPRFKVDYVNETASISADHDDPATALILLAEALGTGDITFAEGLFYQLAKASRTGKEFTAREINMALSTVHAVGPRDATESLLASHMALVHQATMMAVRRLQFAETVDQQNSASNMFNKLARTFTMQIDALKRHRSSGEQKVTVHHQHVSVTAQQAVVGVQQGGGGTNENGSQSHALGEIAGTGSVDACRPAVLSQEQTVGVPMPLAGSEGQERVPDARRPRRCPEGQG